MTSESEQVASVTYAKFNGSSLFASLEIEMINFKFILRIFYYFASAAKTSDLTLAAFCRPLSAGTHTRAREPELSCSGTFQTTLESRNFECSANWRQKN